MNTSKNNSAQISEQTNVPAQLLSKLQQNLDSTISTLSSVHIAQFGYALDRIQATINHFNGPVPDGCTQQIVDILGLQLEGIKEAAKIQQNIDDSRSDFNITLDSNQFVPRAKSGDTLMMQKGAPALDGCIVAVDAGMQENVNGQWVSIEPGIALRLHWYRPGMEYYAVCVAVCPARPAEIVTSGRPLPESLKKMVSVFTTQLDEIPIAAQTQTIDDASSDFVLELTTNEFSPRAKIGQRLGMRRGCLAEDGDLVATKLGDKYRVEWYSPDREYCAVCVAIMAKRPAQQAEIQA